MSSFELVLVPGSRIAHRRVDGATYGRGSRCGTIVPGAVGVSPAVLDRGVALCARCEQD
ncbi:MAG: hypothetical protein WKF57_06320 [Nakamurella sp.]